MIETSLKSIFEKLKLQSNSANPKIRRKRTVPFKGKVFPNFICITLLVDVVPFEHGCDAVKQNLIRTIVLIDDTNCSFPIIKDFIDHIEDSIKEYLKNEFKTEEIELNQATEFIIKNLENDLIDNFIHKLSNFDNW